MDRSSIHWLEARCRRKRCVVMFLIGMINVNIRKDGYLHRYRAKLRFGSSKAFVSQTFNRQEDMSSTRTSSLAWEAKVAWSFPWKRQLEYYMTCLPVRGNTDLSWTSELKEVQDKTRQLESASQSIGSYCPVGASHLGKIVKACMKMNRM